MASSPHTPALFSAIQDTINAFFNSTTVIDGVEYSDVDAASVLDVAVLLAAHMIASMPKHLRAPFILGHVRSIDELSEMIAAKGVLPATIMDGELKRNLN
jgi:hypothetical protein